MAKRKYRRTKGAKRNSFQYAEFIVTNHWDEIAQAIQEEYEMDLNELTFNKRVELIKNVLVGTWSGMLNILYEQRSEIYWQSYKSGFLIAFIIEKNNYVEGAQILEYRAKRKKEYLLNKINNNHGKESD